MDSSTVIVLLSLLTIGSCKDITLGNLEGRKIFDEIRQAIPAIWRQYENVTVIAPDNELISCVVVTDMRPEKDGDVQIVNGGDRQKSVTIELKSPTVLRGYEFHIEVYSVPDTTATDAEENLQNEDMSPVNNSESTELPLPNSTDDDNHDNIPILNNESTVLSDNVNSKDIKDFPTLTSSEFDSNRPARRTEETEENNSQTDVPEDIVTGYESEDDAYITTELPETPEDIVPEPNSDNIRPARETELHTPISGAQSETDSNEYEMTTPDSAAGENLVADETSVINDATTTESIVTTSTYGEATFAPVANDNSKNIPDYASLNILDYIKNKESIRPSRHTEDQKHEENEQTTDSTTKIDETTLLADESNSMTPYDDTVDLVPPKIDASYNTDFADSETTLNPVEGTTLNNVPRAGRGIDYDDNNENESSSTIVSTEDESATTPANDVTTHNLDEDHIVATSDDQFRNTRGANDLEHENDENNQGTLQGNVQSEQVIPNRNVIIINLEEYMARDENNRFIYSLPIVLIINGESKFPIIKIMAEDVSDGSGKDIFPTLPSDEALNPSDFDFKMAENYRIKGDFMPSGDYEQNQ